MTVADAREQPIELRFPCCKRLLRLHNISAVAVTVRERRCPRCTGLWQILIRPLDASAEIVVRQIEWTCLIDGVPMTRMG